MMDLDFVLKELGQFGWYQIKIYVFLFFPLAFGSIASMTYLFTTGDVQYRCLIPECDNSGSENFQKPWLNWAIPHKPGDSIDPCLRFKSIPDSHGGNCSRETFYANQTEYCDKYVFETNEKTITNEFDLLCKKNNWKRTLIGTLNNIGQFMGMPIAGVFSDRYGRKTMILCSALLSSIFGTLRSFSTSYIMFVVLEVLDAMAYSGTYSGIFVYGIEIIGPEKRGIGGAILSSYYSIGEIILGLVVWFVHDWRDYLRILYIPGFFFILYIWVIPESTRWLLTHGKNEKVVEILTCMSVQNRTAISEDVKNRIETLSNGEKDVKELKTSKNEGKKEEYPLKKALTSRIILLRVLNCAFCWITHTFVFYGLSLNSVGIAGNKYLNFILVSFIEIPAYFLSWGMIDFCGRRMSLVIGLAVSGVACTSFHFVDQDAYVLRLILFLTGKLAITESFTTLYVLASEIYPTHMRHSLISFCSTLGRIGSMIAPQTPLMSDFVDPVLMFGTVSFVAAGLSLYFPETLNCKLPDSIEEAENLGKSKMSIDINRAAEKKHSKGDLES